MSIFLTSLNSGSNGNCYYIGNDRHAVLIDAGISCRETERRLSRLGLSIEKVRAIFVSHEHSDHIRGVEVLSRKYNIPVYMSSGTFLSSLYPVEKDLIRTFTANEELEISGFTLSPFPKQHDSSDPYSFTVSHNGITVGVFTDIGEACPTVVHHFSHCHAAFLEANYDERMLEDGNYPLHLKRRIKSRVGHLSNLQALDLFSLYRSPFLTLLILSHLSEYNNHPSIVDKLFSPFANGTRIEIASRYHETAVFCITAP